MNDGLFTQTHQRGLVRAEVGSRAWLLAMLEAEAALAGACGEAGAFPAEAAEAIAAVCADAGRYDEARLGGLAVQTGNPVVGLVAAIREAVGERFAPYVHYGATSQDIIDTAAMLVARRAITALRSDLEGCAEAAALLSRQHRDTPMVARTLLQQAVPTTLGLKAASWLHGLVSVITRLVRLQEALPAQLGGAAGTLEGYPDPGSGLYIAHAFATRLELATPRLPWHTMRYPIGDLAGVLATTAGILGKIALDLVLLAQNEVGEVTTADDAGGRSSAMAHKRNPVAAVAARSSAKQAPGLAATLFASMEQEHERAAGAWQAEWPTLSELLICVGSAAAWLWEALDNVEVNQDRMAANLATLDSSASAGSAAVLVDRALADYRTTERTAERTTDQAPDNGELPTTGNEGTK